MTRALLKLEQEGCVASGWGLSMVTLGVVASVTAGLAAHLPARRVARLDSLVTLRVE